MLLKQLYRIRVSRLGNNRLVVSPSVSPLLDHDRGLLGPSLGINQLLL